jgi:hypothetical protein
MIWPDWSGQTAAIIGTGPSAGKVNYLEIAKSGSKVIAIKSSWRLAAWSDVLYGIDKGWWIANLGAPQFTGLKVSPSPSVCRVFGARLVTLKTTDRILTGEVGRLGCGLRTGGGFSGFQAINLAVQFGAKRIILIGFDMNLSNGAHWSKDVRGVAKPLAERTESWRKSLDAAVTQFDELGVEVINCSSASSLMAYPKMSIEEALHGSSGQNLSDQPRLQAGAGSDAVGASAVSGIS